MSRYVRVSTIGLSPCVITGKNFIDYTQIIIDYLSLHLEKVLCDKPDLIVLPEACDRPANLTYEERVMYYGFRQDKVLEYLKNVAKENNVYITYPAFRNMSDGTNRNSCQMIDRNGEIIGIYNKNHLVINETLKGNIICGANETIFNCDFGKVGAMICFDLNFDEIRDRYKNAKPDIIVFPSMYHGGIMQNYTAYYTRSYFIGAVAGLPSEIISPQGEVFARSTNYFNHITADINLDYEICHLDFNWPKIEQAKQKYGSKIKVHDPGLLGSVLITSETDEFTIKDIVKEFELELLDDYFERALAHKRMYTEK